MWIYSKVRSESLRLLLEYVNNFFAFSHIFSFLCIFEILSRMCWCFAPEFIAHYRCSSIQMLNPRGREYKVKQCASVEIQLDKSSE